MYLDKKKCSTEFPGQLTLEIGKFFLGAPYVVGTLETNKTEHLVVNLREFDCVTFVENVVAITWFLRSRERSFESFQRLLQKIRYRRGRLQGYSSRLHCPPRGLGEKPSPLGEDFSMLAVWSTIESPAIPFMT